MRQGQPEYNRPPRNSTLYSLYSLLCLLLLLTPPLSLPTEAQRGGIGLAILGIGNEGSERTGEPVFDDPEGEGVSCTDKFPDQCPGWGVAGECDANPAFMLVNCPRTCNSCPPSGPEDCKEDLGDPASCNVGLFIGQCVDNPSYYLRFCARSCSDFIPACGERQRSALCDRGNFECGVDPTSVNRWGLAGNDGTNQQWSRAKEISRGKRKRRARERGIRSNKMEEQEGKSRDSHDFADSPEVGKQEAFKEEKDNKGGREKKPSRRENGGKDVIRGPLKKPPTDSDNSWLDYKRRVSHQQGKEVTEYKNQSVHDIEDQDEKNYQHRNTGKLDIMYNNVNAQSEISTENKIIRSKEPSEVVGIGEDLSKGEPQEDIQGVQKSKDLKENQNNVKDKEKLNLWTVSAGGADQARGLAFTDTGGIKQSVEQQISGAIPSGGNRGMLEKREIVSTQGVLSSSEHPIARADTSENLVMQSGRSSSSSQRAGGQGTRKYPKEILELVGEDIIDQIAWTFAMTGGLDDSEDSQVKERVSKYVKTKKSDLEESEDEIISAYARLDDADSATNNGLAFFREGEDYRPEESQDEAHHLQKRQSESSAYYDLCIWPKPENISEDCLPFVPDGLPDGGGLPLAPATFPETGPQKRQSPPICPPQIDVCSATVGVGVIAVGVATIVSILTLVEPTPVPETIPTLPPIPPEFVQMIQQPTQTLGTVPPTTPAPQISPTPDSSQVTSASQTASAAAAASLALAGLSSLDIMTRSLVPFCRIEGFLDLVDKIRPSLTNTGRPLSPDTIQSILAINYCQHGGSSIPSLALPIQSEIPRAKPPRRWPGVSYPGLAIHVDPTTTTSTRSPTVITDSLSTPRTPQGTPRPEGEGFTRRPTADGVGYATIPSYEGSGFGTSIYDRA